MNENEKDKKTKASSSKNLNTLNLKNKNTIKKIKAKKRAQAYKKLLKNSSRKILNIIKSSGMVLGRSKKVKEQNTKLKQTHYKAKPYNTEEITRESLEKRGFTPMPEKSDAIRVWDPFTTPVEPPVTYLKDRVILLTIDPKFVYAYWEVNRETLEAAKMDMGYDSYLVLRFYDVTCMDSFDGTNAHSFWDVPVPFSMGGWYVELDNANKNLVVEIGLKNGYGTFYKLIRSNYFHVPRSQITDNEKISWMVTNPTGECYVTKEENYTSEDLLFLKGLLGDKCYDKLINGSLGEYLSSSETRTFFKDVKSTVGKLQSSSLSV